MLNTKVAGDEGRSGRHSRDVRRPRTASRPEQMFDKRAGFRRPRARIPRFPASRRPRHEDREGLHRSRRQRRTNDPAIYRDRRRRRRTDAGAQGVARRPRGGRGDRGQEVAFEPQAIPAVVFTDPEIAWCGLTEADAQAQGPRRQGRALFRGLHPGAP